MGLLNIDVVLCIDGTAGMIPIMDQVREFACSLPNAIPEGVIACGRGVSNLRVKAIVFGDYGTGEDVLRESAFYKLPEQADTFCSFVKEIDPHGGGQQRPQCALEAIVAAMKSEWMPRQPNTWCRQLVVVISNAPARPLGERAGLPGYPVGMPKDFSEFADWWDMGLPLELNANYNPKYGRLVAFVPYDNTWTMLEYLNRSCICYDNRDVGVNDSLCVNMVIDTLAAS